MLNKILNTSATKITAAIINFFVLMLVTNNLGAQGTGFISVFVLSAVVILTVNELVGGSALVYLVPRYNFTNIMAISYLWSFLIILIFIPVVKTFTIVPQEYQMHVIVLALIYSITNTNYNVLVGKERVAAYNWLTLGQIVLMLSVLYIAFFHCASKNIFAYITALYISNGIIMLISCILLFPYITRWNTENIKGLLKEIFTMGAFSQLMRIAQLLNYRMSYFMIEKFLGLPMLGKFSVGTQISESPWLISRSIGLVQYSGIANMEDKHQARLITIRLLKFSLVMTVMLVATILIIPDSTYVYLFGNDFKNLFPVFASLSFGIVAMSSQLITGHYLSGTGNLRYNMLSSLIGLVVTICAGLMLIPRFGIVGAGLTASLSYTATATHNMIMFFRTSGATLRELVPCRDDMTYIKEVIRRLK